jgi:hypothetical protein
MGYFKKKPVVIEAFEFDGTFVSAERIKTWALYYNTIINIQEAIDGVCSLAIPTFEGITYATPNDFVVRGIQDEFYPCKPDIFLETHHALT